MRLPQRPPIVDDLLDDRLARSDPLSFVARILDVPVAKDRYLPWDELRRRRPPEGLTSEEWWLATKLARNGMRRELPLIGQDGRRLSYALPDEVLRGIEVVDRQTSGRLGVPEQVAHDAPDRDRYLISS